ERRDCMTREDTPLDIVAGLMIHTASAASPVANAGGGLRGIITEAEFTGNERNVPFGALVMPHAFDAPPDMEEVELVWTQAGQMTSGLASGLTSEAGTCTGKRRRALRVTFTCSASCYRWTARQPSSGDQTLPGDTAAEVAAVSSGCSRLGRMKRY